MSTEPEDQVRRLTAALDAYAPPVAEDELWHRLDADGPDSAPVTLIDLHRNAAPARRAGWTVIAVAGLVAGLIGIVTLVTRPTEQVSGGAPGTTPVPAVATTSSTLVTTTASAAEPTVPLPANLPPVAVADSATTSSGGSEVLIDVLANDADPDGDPLRVIDVTSLDSSVGDASVRVVNSAVVFSPTDPCRLGNYTFVYEVTDGQPGSRPSTGTVTVQVVPSLGPAPVANPDLFTVSADSLSLELPAAVLLANDTSSDPCHELQVVAVTDPPGGRATLGDDAVLVELSPDAAGGSFTFTYMVSDGALWATATVTVAGV